MKLIILFTPIFFIISNLHSQNKFPEWDKNYKLESPKNILESEIDYSKKVEGDINEAQYYVAANKYRFVAKFTGNTRKITDTKKNSMSRIVLLKFGKKGFIEDIVDSEYEFIIENKTIWIPIQNVLEKDFNKEIPKNNDVLLYNLFLNEHTSKKELFNHFLISEFSIDWN